MYRSKLGTACFPEIDTVQESPYRTIKPIPGLPRLVNVTQPTKETKFTGNGNNCLPQSTNAEREEIISSSDEDLGETPDALDLLSLYLPPPSLTSEGLDVSSKDQHPPEPPTDSMVAFRLATPPKEARLNFVNITSSLL